MPKKQKTPCLGGVYRITCLANSRSYVGSTKLPFLERWKQHRDGLKRKDHRNGHLQNAWDKYGESFFEFHPLEPVQFVEDLIDREQAWIDIYQACDRAYGFNIVPRADRTCQAEETKAKIGLAHTGKKRSPEHIEKMRAANIGKKLSPEHIEKMRAANIGKKHSLETLEKMRGKKRSPEHIEKLRAAKISKNPFYYRVTTPEGIVYDQVTNLRDFCRRIGELGYTSLFNVASGIRAHHKGWKCEKLLKAQLSVDLSNLQLLQTLCKVG